MHDWSPQNGQVNVPISYRAAVNQQVTVDSYTPRRTLGEQDSGGASLYPFDPPRVPASHRPLGHHSDPKARTRPNSQRTRNHNNWVIPSGLSPSLISPFFVLLLACSAFPRFTVPGSPGSAGSAGSAGIRAKFARVGGGRVVRQCGWFSLGAVSAFLLDVSTWESLQVNVSTTIRQFPRRL